MKVDGAVPPQVPSASSIRRPARLRPRRPWPWRLLRTLLLLIAALWFLFEEFGWRPLAAWVGRLALWAPWARVEARIARLPPRPALLLFLVPVVALLPVKLAALKLMHDGHGVAGIALILAAKLVGTAIGGRLYVLLRRPLMRLPWFARAIAGWRLTRLRARRALRRLGDWRTLRARWRLRWSGWAQRWRRPRG